MNKEFIHYKQKKLYQHINSVIITLDSSDSRIERDVQSTSGTSDDNFAMTRKVFYKIFVSKDRHYTCSS